MNFFFCFFPSRSQRIRIASPLVYLPAVVIFRGSRPARQKAGSRSTVFVHFLTLQHVLHAPPMAPTLRFTSSPDSASTTRLMGQRKQCQNRKSPGLPRALLVQRRENTYRNLPNAIAGALLTVSDWSQSARGLGCVRT